MISTLNVCFLESSFELNTNKNLGKFASKNEIENAKSLLVFEFHESKFVHPVPTNISTHIQRWAEVGAKRHGYTKCSKKMLIATKLVMIYKINL